MLAIFSVALVVPSSWNAFLPELHSTVTSYNSGFSSNTIPEREPL